MSACISRFGEFGTHTLNADHECVRCGTFDTAALAGELGALRAVLDGLRALVLGAVSAQPRPGTDITVLGPGVAVIDYRTLLIKYIDHVGREEGTAFLDSLAGGRRRPGRFTDGEWAELNHLASVDVATLDPSSGTWADGTPVL